MTYITPSPIQARLRKVAPGSPSLRAATESPSSTPSSSPSVSSPIRSRSPATTARVPEMHLSPEPDRKMPPRVRQPASEQTSSLESSPASPAPDTVTRSGEDAFISKRDAPEGVRQARRQNSQASRALLAQSRANRSDANPPLPPASLLTPFNPPALVPDAQSTDDGSNIVSPRSRTIRTGFIPVLPSPAVLAQIPPPFPLEPPPHIHLEPASPPGVVIRKSRDYAEQGEDDSGSLSLSSSFPRSPPPPPPNETVPPKKKSSNSFCAYEVLPPPPPLPSEGNRLAASDGDATGVRQWKEEKRHSGDTENESQSEEEGFKAGKWRRSLGKYSQIQLIS